MGSDVASRNEQFQCVRLASADGGFASSCCCCCHLISSILLSFNWREGKGKIKNKSECKVRIKCRSKGKTKSKSNNNSTVCSHSSIQFLPSLRMHCDLYACVSICVHVCECVCELSVYLCARTYSLDARTAVRHSVIILCFGLRVLFFVSRFGSVRFWLLIKDDGSVSDLWSCH